MRTTAQGGFSLLEVMMAVTLFTTFTAAFMVSQGYNLADSALSEEQLKLHMLAEQRMNDLLINPPKFNNALENLKETKPFEEEGFKSYSWTVEWKRLKVPDFGKIFAAQGQASAAGSEGDDNSYFDDSAKSARNSTVETMVFDKLKQNMEKVLWQVRLTATNTDTKYTYTLSRWVRNRDEPIQLNLSF